MAAGAHGQAGMNYEEIAEFIKNDKRTPSEIFESLRQRMKELSGFTISEEEATRAVRNLIGLCETIMRIPMDERSNQLEPSDYAE